MCLVTKSSCLLLLELRFSIDAKHLFIWVSVCNAWGEDSVESSQ